MIKQKYLHEKIREMRLNDDSWYKPLPNFITDNLNQNFELRGYQIESIRNFISYFEDSNLKANPTQLLFQMATGSGKTIIMAALIVYLFSKGYHKFVFCVNSNNIIEKTIDNFMNFQSNKFLFRYDSEIELNSRKYKIKKTESFSDNTQDIQILFATIQKLHSNLVNSVRENSVSYDDFSDGIVVISDEAHHLNADTKNRRIKEDNNSWEATVNSILNQSNRNILLEFTATAGLKNDAIRDAYIGKLIYDYPLESFYRNGYSKEIKSLRSDLEMEDRIIQAVIISQLRLKLFSDNKIAVKPVILFKSRRIEDNSSNLNLFNRLIKDLSVETIKRILKNSKSDICALANQYFVDKKIDFSTLLFEIQSDFSPEHCLITDSKNAKENKKKDPALDKDVQLLLNSLEDFKNPYRAIFAVDQLNEGWDVLNLFDIVRLYDTRQDGGKSQSYTIKEAQLIGRGARYCPFYLNDDTANKYQRKFDNDDSNILRLCETLYYHCYNEERYISELRNALKATGLDMDPKVKTIKYELKNNFKKNKLYSKGVVFANKRIPIKKDDIKGIDPKVVNAIYSYNEYSGFASTDNLFDTDNLKTSTGSMKVIIKSLRDVASTYYSVVNKASRQYISLAFTNLLRHYPNLKSLREFFTSDNYLGKVNISISSVESSTFISTLYKALLKLFSKLSAYLCSRKSDYIGTRVFYPLSIKDVFTDKIITITCTAENGGKGVAQSCSDAGDYQLDLPGTDWYIYNDNYGTTEEKALIKHLASYVDSLKEKYSEVYLIRNELQYVLYSFDEGNTFKPDFLLILANQSKDMYEQIQVIIEPKGENLIEKDKWKENFLLQINESDKSHIIFENADFRIIGFHFTNFTGKDNECKIRKELFETDMQGLLS